ncbi:MAG: hypothetical protein AAGA48_03995 [Myxococcota bacterium]
MLGLLLLVGCGLWREGGGTAVGNPGTASVRIAPPDTEGSVWEVATARRVSATFTSCEGEAGSVIVEEDLLEGAAFRIPDGQWCTLDVGLQNLRAAGETLTEIDEATATIDIRGVVFARERWIIELGEPGDVEGLARRSGVYREIEADGQLDLLERAQGAAGRGADRAPDNPEPPVLLVVGDPGLRASVTTPPAPTYLQTEAAGFFGAAAYANGRWVVVGGDASGRSGTSVDQGLTWELTDTEPVLSTVTAFDGRFVAASFGGDLLSSDDGLAWTVRAQEGVVWRVMTASPDTIVVLSDEEVGVSSDGERWTFGTIPGAPEFFGLTWGPPGFVAVGEGGERWRSTDGLVWTFVDEGGGKLQSVAWSGTAYVAVGDLDGWRSTDGLSWFPIPEKPLDAIVAHNGALFGVWEQVVSRTEDDGDSWAFWAELSEGGARNLATNRP